MEEAIIKLVRNQASELMKNQFVIEGIRDLKTEEEKQVWLLIATIYSLMKSNKTDMKANEIVWKSEKNN